MRKLLLNAIAIGVGVLAFTTGAQAVPVTMSTALTSGSFSTDGDDALSKVRSNIASATFDYSGPLSFNVGPPQNTTSAGDLNSAFFDASKISNYVGIGSLAAPANADYGTLDSFLASSASVAGYAYGSYLTFDLGVLGAGTVLTITHDDGVSIYQGLAKVGNTVSGPTQAVTESVTLADTADTMLVYSRQNGAPSVLDVQVAAVPEPETYALMAVGLLSIACLRRRSNKA